MTHEFGWMLSNGHAVETKYLSDNLQAISELWELLIYLQI